MDERGHSHGHRDRPNAWRRLRPRDTRSRSVTARRATRATLTPSRSMRARCGPTSPTATPREPALRDPRRHTPSRHAMTSTVLYQSTLGNPETASPRMPCRSGASTWSPRDHAAPAPLRGRWRAGPACAARRTTRRATRGPARTRGSSREIPASLPTADEIAAPIAVSENPASSEETVPPNVRRRSGVPGSSCTARLAVQTFSSARNRRGRQ